MSEETIPRIPNLGVPALRFVLSLPHITDDARESSKGKLLEAIKKDDMAPYYRLVAADLKFAPGSVDIDAMEQRNTEELRKLEERLQDAEQNLGETEVTETLRLKAQYLAQIGEKEKALSAYRVAIDKTGPLGSRIDMVFATIRIGFFFQDNDIIARNIEKVKSLIEEGGDWDRRNRLKVYEGIHCLANRDFKGAVNLLLDSLATFTSTELMDYKDFVRYTVLASALTLKRPDIKKKVINSPEILEVIHEIQYAEDFVTSLYNSDYKKFFASLALVEKSLKTDWILYPHHRYYVREMRIIAYTQLLESYRSLTIESMANSFGVSEEYVDQDLARFIAAGRLNAVIDKVGGIVETNRPDAKNHQYQTAIKSGDALLNRLQKLTRVITA
ncbi:PCI-domain-containing protein [Gonapodya prolifera JEL478]|uniref:PCI-domain-containing protein n=1 Tax=Gonapodya prolifera (strain JEL478) TaxID=1344416 RepID=A0A139AUL3_GONPJ|nr:PCI-domain-containing protein [Gonapodya prolifera JEL478]|eukprot:KXS20430.1 PCI-domain-containing protein [Gonapodya prolifera JEL478]